MVDRIDCLVQERRGEPWFDDGNILLVTYDSPTTFRVHRGVLARHSEVFQGMFDIAESTHSGPQTSDGCPIVYVYDAPFELSNLITALYDGAEFHNRGSEDFFHLASILRLSTKYFIGNLRTQAIRFLTETWPYTLKGHDEMVHAALNTHNIGNTTYPYVHPLHVLNLAREVDVNIVVPSSLYFLSLYPLADILKGDHPKLTIEHLSKPSSVLTSHDLQLYTVMYQHRLQVILDFVRNICQERPIDENCVNPDSCRKRFLRLWSLLSRSWVLRTGPLHYMVQATIEVAQDTTVCNICRISFQNDVDKFREAIWQGLPIAVGLPSWEKLVKSDLYGPSL